MSKKLMIVSTLLLVALLAAACGADDPTSTPRPTATATPTSESPASDTTTGDGDTMVKDGDTMTKDDDAMTKDGDTMVKDDDGDTMTKDDDAMKKDGDTMMKDGDAMMGGAWELNIVNFSHEDATITVGATVNWTNTGSAPHTTTSGAPGAVTGLWDSGTLSTNSAHSYTFNDTGAFAYYCTIHPNMVATITVVAEGEETTSGKEGTVKSGGGGLYD